MTFETTAKLKATGLDLRVEEDGGQKGPKERNKFSSFKLKLFSSVYINIYHIFVNVYITVYSNIRIVINSYTLYYSFGSILCFGGCIVDLPD